MAKRFIIITVFDIGVTFFTYVKILRHWIHVGNQMIRKGHLDKNDCINKTKTTEKMVSKINLTWFLRYVFKWPHSILFDMIHARGTHSFAYTFSYCIETCKQTNGEPNEFTSHHNHMAWTQIAFVYKRKEFISDTNQLNDSFNWKEFNVIYDICVSVYSRMHT